MMKRFISLFIVVLLAFGAFAVCSATAEDSKTVITLNGTDYEAENGDKVTYTMELQCDQLIECGQFIIYYPKDILKVESGALKNVKNEHCNLKVEGEVNCNFLTPMNYFDFSEKKTLLEVEFSVISAGKGELTKTVKGFYNENDKKITENLELFESLTVTKPEPETTAPEVETTSPETESGTTSSESAATDSSESFSTEMTDSTSQATDASSAAESQSTESTELESSQADAESTSATEPSEIVTEPSEASSTAQDSTQAESVTQQEGTTSATQDTTVKPETEPVETTEAPPTTTAATDPTEQVPTEATEETSPVKVKTGFLTMMAKAGKVNKSAVKLSWKKYKNAASYIVYGSKASGKYKLIKTVKTNSLTVKKLKKATYYKFYIAAKDKNKNVIAKSAAIYAATSGSKYTNPTSVKLNKKSVALKAKKSFKIKAAIIKPSGKKIKKYRKTAFVSTNPKIAAVNAKGKVIAKKKGSANIYVYAQNGVCARVKVIVK